MLYLIIGVLVVAALVVGGLLVSGRRRVKGPTAGHRHHLATGGGVDAGGVSRRAAC